MPVDPSKCSELGLLPTLPPSRSFNWVGAGKIKLDDDISTHLPIFLRRPKVTIAHLLNQTSGLPSYTDEKTGSATWRQEPQTQ